jgi:archaellum component FlaG (FlaF/FlaG flagellin family)
MSKRIVVMTFALLFALASFAAPSAKTKASGNEKGAAAAVAGDEKPAAASEKSGRLTLVEPVKEFGEIPKGDKLDWSFLVKNTGDADLQIISAKPGCGCTVADFDKVIKPGETGKVTAHVDTTNFAGPIAKTVSIETNDPTNPQATLTIHATVKPYVEAFPAGFVRFNLLQGDAETQSLTLYSDEDAPFEITKVETPGDWVKVNYAKIEDPAQRAQVGKAAQNQYKVDITVGGDDAKIGPLADKVHIITNSKHQPDYFVSVTGVVRPTFRVEPTGINFGEVVPNDPSATRAIILRSNNLKAPELFNVSKAESSNPSVAASVKPTEHKGEYEVTLQLAKDAKPGDLDGTVKIYTNDKINPVVTLPVKAVVKTAAK